MFVEAFEDARSLRVLHREGFDWLGVQQQLSML